MEVIRLDESAGRIMGHIGENSQPISDALDRIPTIGPVTRDDYLEYAGLFRSGFAETGRELGDGVAGASRPLAMKRPDYFVCFDKANREGLGEALGFGGSWHKDYPGYWDEVIERVLDATWWNASRPPGGIEADMWDGRVAFLDAIYYDPDFLK